MAVFFGLGIYANTDIFISLISVFAVSFHFLFHSPKNDFYLKKRIMRLCLFFLMFFMGLFLMSVKEENHDKTIQ